MKNPDQVLWCTSIVLFVNETTLFGLSHHLSVSRFTINSATIVIMVFSILLFVVSLLSYFFFWISKCSENGVLNRESLEVLVQVQNVTEKVQYRTAASEQNSDALNI
jgi:hypothetical protein